MRRTSPRHPRFTALPFAGRRVAMDKAHVQALFRQRAEARGVPAATGRLPIARPAVHGATEQTPAAHEPAVQALAAPEALSEPAAKKQRVASEAAAVVPVPPPPQALPAGFFDDGSKPRDKAQPKGRPDAAVQDVKCAVPRALSCGVGELSTHRGVTFPVLLFRSSRLLSRRMWRLLTSGSG